MNVDANYHPLSKEDFENGLRVMMEQISQLRAMVEKNSQVINERYLSVSSFAERIDMSPVTVREWCIKGMIEADQNGPKGRWRIPYSQLEIIRNRAKQNNYNKLR